MTDHTLSCAILALSHELLSCGLLNILKSGALKSSSPLSSHHLFNLVRKLLNSKTSSIIASLTDIIRRYCHIDPESISITEVLLGGVGGILFDESSSKSSDAASFMRCCISQCQYGRCIETTKGVGRGNILLRERCFAAALKSSCSCHQTVVLNEYVTLAWATALVVCCDSNIMKDKTKEEVILSQSVKCIPLSSDKIEGYRRILSDFGSGLGANVLSSWDLNINEPSAYQGKEFWPFQVQALMAVVSCLCSMLTEYIIYKQPGSSKMNSVIESQIIFDILSRIPTNIHAVYHVSQSNSSSQDVTVEQQRLGYALYLSASSANHHCSPNSILRYQFEYPSSSRLSMLSSAAIEIIPTKSIASGEEITISYGPIVGKHSYSSRQECLLTQFLFQCACSSCISELNQKKIEVSPEPLTESDKTSSSIFETVLLCERLPVLRGDVESLNREVTVLLTSQPSPSKSDLLKFHTSKISPLHDSLLTLKIRNFPADVCVQDSMTGRNTSSKKAGIERDIYMEFATVYTTLLDIEARILSSAGKFLDSANNVREAINLMIESELFRATDVAIDREYVKLAQLYFSAGDFNLAKHYSSKAVKNLEKFVSTQDPDLVEALCMLRYIQAIK